MDDELLGRQVGRDMELCAESVEMNSRPVSSTENEHVQEVVRSLERELRAYGKQRWLTRLRWLLVVVALVGGWLAWQRFRTPEAVSSYTTERVVRRDIVEQVQSTGTIKPLKEVQVGAQVSGRVVKVHVDFNSRVRQGDLLAEIDPSLFGAQVSQSDAQLRAAEANVSRAEARLASAALTLKRVQSLAAERIATQAEVDQARGEHEVAAADVNAARAQITQLGAQLRSAKTTLAYTRIYSPIDGLVINRSVDPGQTVAASFSAPVLFVIAQDLAKMQVLADIDEADVGKLKEGMPAEVAADAFPGRAFHGTITQLRYSPNTVQGVVTYSAVIDVDNPALELRPGMTATVMVTTRRANNVIAVKNSALRFRPAASDKPDGPKTPEAPLAPLQHGQGRVHVLAGGEPGHERLTPKTVKLGLTDGSWTELADGAVAIGAAVVTEQRDAKGKPGFRLF
jgi:HlyD family secretion protein